MLLTIAALALGGCKPDVMSTGGEASPAADEQPSSPQEVSPVPARLVGLTLRPADAIPPGAPGVEQVQGWLEASFKGNPEFAPPPGEAGPTARARGSYRAQHQEARDASGQRLGAVFLELDVSLHDAQGKRLERFSTEAFVGEALPDGEDPDKALAQLVQRVGDEVAGSLARQIRARYATDEALLDHLTRLDDKALLEPSILEVRRRRVRDATDKLVALLKHPERDIVNIAASTLGDVGDQTAVPALIDSGSRVGVEDRLPVLYALGKLGGPQAILYLETLSKEADEPTLARAASQALTEARKNTPTP